MEDGKHTAVITVMNNETYQTKSIDIQLDDGLILVGDREECVIGVDNPVALYKMVGDVVMSYTADHYPKDKRGSCSVYGLMMLVDSFTDRFEDDLDPRILKAVRDAIDVISEVIDEEISVEIRKQADLVSKMLESDSVDEWLKEAIRDYMNKEKKDA